MGGISADLSRFRYVSATFDRIPPVWSTWRGSERVQRTCVYSRYAELDKKKPPEGLEGLISGVSGLGELDLGLVEGSEVAQGLRFVSI